MIGVEVLLTVIPGLPKSDLERWIANNWIKPDGRDGAYRFADIDVARVKLILELRDELEVNEAALPVVLLLLDQVYDLRRQIGRINAPVSRQD
ncbi:chaperone modulator CbpM [Caulobacter sp. DWP3-1-3b2]|uniref:chaperone modulator CbpM n=1 Tax=Caulobacter sp. DWP3-1-3b2 TaxID=2804643 RepID=UPI003CED8A7B